mgnify:CR=1 FL=1
MSELERLLAALIVVARLSQHQGPLDNITDEDLDTEYNEAESIASLLADKIHGVDQ